MSVAKEVEATANKCEICPHLAAPMGDFHTAVLLCSFYCVLCFQVYFFLYSAVDIKKLRQEQNALLTSVPLCEEQLKYCSCDIQRTVQHITFSCIEHLEAEEKKSICIYCSNKLNLSDFDQ